MRRVLIIAGLTIMVALATAPIVSARPADSAAGADVATRAGEACDENTNPLAVVLCDGSGDVALRLNGSALYIGLDEGTIAIRTDSAPLRPMRQRIPCLDDDDAEVVTLRDGEYKVCEGPIFTKLRKGSWNLRLSGSGINAAIFGRGVVWLQGESGLISVLGDPYVDWPTEWTAYRFPQRSFKSPPPAPTERP